MRSALHQATSARQLGSHVINSATYIRAPSPAFTAKGATASPRGRAYCKHLMTYAASPIVQRRVTRAVATTAAKDSSNNGASEPAAVSATAKEDSYDFDVFVIGGGSGGVRTARVASEKGIHHWVTPASLIKCHAAASVTATLHHLKSCSGSTGAHQLIAPVKCGPGCATCCSSQTVLCCYCSSCCSGRVTISSSTLRLNMVGQ